ncbi:MAG: hypothetical protein J7M17_03205 [Anaerolineae bacterium]|nr:hypothetical protein [Anaerolineae bacterium]
MTLEFQTRDWPSDGTLKFSDVITVEFWNWTMEHWVTISTPEVGTSLTLGGVQAQQFLDATGRLRLRLTPSTDVPPIKVLITIDGTR